MIKIFDTHAHYDDHMYDEDRENILQSMKDKGVLRITNIGADLDTSKHAIELADTHDFMYASVGVHPTETLPYRGKDIVTPLREMAKASDKVVAIGEIGLDYHYDDTDKDLQDRIFREQLELAKELNLPVIIHSREAAQPTMDIMKEEAAGKLSGVIHCFSYEQEVAKFFLDMGFMIGIGGVVTFKNSRKLKEVVTYAPLDMIVLETDAPYLSPTPFRGERNNSAYITYVAEEIAALKNIPVDDVYEATWQNAHRLYRL